MLFPITTGRYASLLLMMQAAYCKEERGYETEVIGVDCSFQHNHHGNYTALYTHHQDFAFSSSAFCRQSYAFPSFFINCYIYYVGTQLAHTKPSHCNSTKKFKSTENCRMLFIFICLFILRFHSWCGVPIILLYMYSDRTILLLLLTLTD